MSLPLFMNKIGTIKGDWKRCESLRMSDNSKTLWLQILKILKPGHIFVRKPYLLRELRILESRPGAIPGAVHVDGVRK